MFKIQKKGGITMGVSMSGLSSGLDTDSIVSALVSSYSLKKDNLVKAQTKLEWKQDAWKDLNKKIYSFYSGSLSNMRFSSGYNVKKATSSSTKATVSASTDAVNGTQTLKVKSLAASGYLTGGVVDKVSDGNGGKTTVKGSTKLSEMGIASGSKMAVQADGKESTISVTDDMTVNQFVAALKDAGVNASFDENNQRFFVSSKKSGASGDFSLTASNDNGTTALKKLGLMAYSDADADKYAALAAMDVDAKVAEEYAKQKKAHIDADTARTTLQDEADTLTNANKQLEKDIKTAQYKASYARNYANVSVADNHYEADLQTAIDALKANSSLTDEQKQELEDKETELAAVKSVNKQYLNDTLTSADRLDMADTYDTELSSLRDTLADNQTQLSKNNEILNDTTGTKMNEYVTAENNEIDQSNTQLESDLRAYYTEQKAKAQQMSALYDTYKNYNADTATADETAAYNTAKAALGLESTTATRISGADSEIELNGATFTSTTNNFNINGLTINVNAKTEGDEVINLTTSTDVDGIYDKVKEFFSTYNSLINEMDSLYNASSSKGYEPLTDDEKDAMSDKEVEKWEAKIKDSLLRKDQTLNSVASAMKNAFMKTYEVDGKKYSLASFGIKTGGYFVAADNTKSAYHIDGDEDDELTSGNADKLKAAIANDPETFTSFFTQLTKGVYDELYKKMQSTSLSSAYTVYNDKSMQKEYNNYKKDIATWEERIEKYEEKYRKQFSAMEKALSTLNSQQSQLAGLFNS